MTSRERVNLALQHREADRVPLDVGATTVTGMHVTSVYLLQQALGLDPPNTPVRVMDPLLMLGEIRPDLMAALGIDVVKLGGRTTSLWKTFIHSCGSVWTLIDDFIAAGFDILNPLQCSAANMDPGELKKRFGSRITFWGGGVDTQQTLPFGAPDDVRKQVRERLEQFGPAGSFIFTAIHNIQALVPVANLLAMFETVRDYGRYPL